MDRRKTAAKISMQNLPDDVILEIFLRLPAKSLYRFRCVSKPWRSELHSNFVRSRDRNDQKLILINPVSYSIFDCYETTIDDDDDANAALTETVEYPFKTNLTTSVPPRADEEFVLLDSSDSLFLLGHKIKRSDVLFLLNPSSREYQEFEFRFYDYRNFDHYSYWICCGASQHEVKVISLVMGITNLQSQYFTVYSLETKSWTKIIDFPYNDFDYYSGHRASVNGAPHWVCRRDHTNYILSFDMKMENFTQVPTPCGFTVRPFLLTAMRGNLCATSCCESLMMWEMKEYGVKESWTLVFSIPRRVIRGIDILIPLAITKRGDLILLSPDGLRLSIFNQKEKLKTLMTFEESMTRRIALCNS